MYLPYQHARTPDHDELWVITVISNPQRFKSRYELYGRFARAVEKAGGRLVTVEAAFGTRPHEVTQAGNPRHVQLRVHDEIWHKENLINIGVSHLPPSWRYVAWIDADVEFVREDWVAETVQQLQHYKMIQMFQHALDMGPQGDLMTTFDGFAWAFATGKEPPHRRAPNAPNPYYGRGLRPNWHPGFAWAARREAFEGVGGLIDFAILGAADHHMAWALLGDVKVRTPKDISPAYLKHLLTWEARAQVAVRQNLGYMPGTIYHHWHGPKANRRYGERWEILLRHGYDPDLDLQRDWQGLHRLSDRGERMRNDLRGYFAQRNEDSIDR